MKSRDEIDQHIGVWTLIQLLESNGDSPMIPDLITDVQIQKLIRQIPEIPDLLRSILRGASGEEATTDETPEETSDEACEEGNEVVSLTRTALSSLRKIPTLEELERMTQSGRGKGTAVEGDVSSGVQRKEV